MDPIEIVIASNSADKISEIREILSQLPVLLLTRDDVGGWPEIAETGTSYLENALLKAQEVMKVTGRAALADDSGIEVDALDGAPGIHSARFAGVDSTEEQNNTKLIEKLAGIPPGERSASYRCAAVIVFPDGQIVGAVGSCDGSISTQARGSGGFGYDPWFLPEGDTRTMAELTPAEKHSISHRGRALRGLVDQLQRTLRPD